MKKTKKEVELICYDIQDFKWERCMFGCVIHSKDYTIRIWKKKQQGTKR